MQIDTHGNDNGLNDLYILPENNVENLLMRTFLERTQIPCRWLKSDVIGHSWYGKQFIEIPFGEHLKARLETIFH